MRRRKPSNNNDFELGWRQRFSQYARVRDDDAGIAGWTQTGLETRVRNFGGIWEPSKSGIHWLDAGCGAGTYSRYMVSMGKQVVGLDYCFPAVKKAATRSSAGSYWAVADVKRLPVATGSFDGAICFGVTQALSTSRDVSRELANAVRPGGEVWIDALNLTCLPHLLGHVKRFILRRNMHLRYEWPWRLRGAMADAGIENMETFWIPILPYRVHRYQWVFETRIARWVLQKIPLLGALVSHGFIVKGYRGQ